ncbi:MAG: SUMF1/EgtB/PvdO family nonheme iron enzyme [Gammaproteobacteria bacterium]|nr:SUMF1/EgtB/PvdO family nonheme iron enzyme [Gammaproteobacteria bacterium]
MNSMKYAELEIGLHSHGAKHYAVDLRFTRPDSEADLPPVRGQATFDLHELLSRQLNPDAYGQCLTECLFADENLKTAYTQFKTAMESSGLYLRMRLFIGSDTPELHALRWELLHDPGSRQPLIGSEKVLFSRYIASADWRPVRLSPKSAMKALLAVANGNNLSQYNLADIQVKEEIQRARAGLGEGIATSVLGEEQSVTLDSLDRVLRKQTDILYLVCHGKFVNGAAILYLQDEAGQTAPVKGGELARRMENLAVPPRLAVLISCESAGTGEQADMAADISAALAPLLNEAGVPAVLAMQGKFSMTTAEKFMPAFFTELRRDGCIDRALAVARGTVHGRHDWWMPVLFMRLKNGQLWLPSSEDQSPKHAFEPETVPIPAGSFQMGSPPDNGIPTHETPRHPVKLAAYRIGKYPVTNKEYQEFIKHNPQQEVPGRKAGWFLRQPKPNTLKHPVTGISWHNAKAYCDWLSKRTGKRYRLPTEAEWEKAAGGPQGFFYPWGNAWMDGYCNINKPGPVGAHPQGASEYGCEEMLGNIQEWTATLWGSDPDETAFPYPYQKDDGRNEPDADKYLHRVYRIHRGGCYRDTPNKLRCSVRGFSIADSKVIWRGFRVALEID